MFSKPCYGNVGPQLYLGKPRRSEGEELADMRAVPICSCSEEGPRPPSFIFHCSLKICSFNRDHGYGSQPVALVKMASCFQPSGNPFTTWFFVFLWFKQ